TRAERVLGGHGEVPSGGVQDRASPREAGAESAGPGGGWRGALPEPIGSLGMAETEGEFRRLQDAEIPEVLPGMVLVSTVVFPYDVVSVQVNKAKSLRMLDEAVGDNAIVGCFFPKDPEAEDAEKGEDLHPVGVA